MRTALVVLFLSIATLAPAQGRNVVYGEIGGNGIAPTINYERQFGDRLFGRAGLGVVYGESSSGDSDTTFVIPLMLNYLSHPAGNHHFELGGGFTLVTGESQDFFDDVDEDETISNLVGTATIGYRFQRPVRGFVFKAGITPVFVESEVFPWGGVSFGYRW